MAEGLELLFKLRAQNQASPVVHAVQADVAKLKTSFGSDFNAMQGAATRALGGITQSLTAFTGQMPVVGSAVRVVSGEFANMAAESTSAGGAVAGLAGPIGIATVAVLALATAGVMAVQKLFDLTKSAADFQGKMFDLSQQTGVSVETLSALEVMAKTTGGSIEAIAASLGIFQKNLEAAQDPTSKEAVLLKDLGIETKTTEGALRDAMKSLAAMPEGFHQTATALELFGRGGKSILAILKEMGGDLDGTIEKLRAMGILITTENAKAADKFNDDLAMVQFQLRAVGGTLTKELMPVFKEMFGEVGDGLVKNQKQWEEWGSSLASIVRGLSVIVHSETTATAAHIFATYNPIFHLLQQSAALLKFIGGKGSSNAPYPGYGVFPTGSTEDNMARHEAGLDKDMAFPVGTAPPPRSTRGGGGGGRSARVTKSTEERDAERQEKAELKFYEDLVGQVKKTVDQLNLIDISTNKYAVDQSILNGVLSKASVEMQNMAVTEARVLDNKEKQLQLQNKLKAYFETQAEDIKEVTQGTVTYLGEAQKFIESLEKQGAVLSANQKWWIQFSASVIDANKEVIDLTRVMEPLLYTMEKLGDIDTKIDIDMSKVPLPDKDTKGGPFAAFSDELDAIGALSKNTSDIIGGTLAGAFGMLAEGVGAAVQSFILFGEVEGGFRKFAAEMISSIAATAAVQAVFQLAQGLAWLALNAFFPNPKYAEAAGMAFASAAVFGSIAGVATVAGRVLAGDSFKQGGAATGGGSGGGGGGTGGGKSDKPGTIDIGRRQGSNAPPVYIILQGDLKEDYFETRVANATAKNWGRGGKIRQVASGDGVFVP